MAKAPYLKEYKREIESWVLKEYLDSHRKALGKEVLVTVNSKLKVRANREISISYINAILADLRKKDGQGVLDMPEDQPWSIGACLTLQYKQYFPPESLEMLIRFKFGSWAKFFDAPDFSPLTIRVAKWIIKLLPLVKCTLKEETISKIVGQSLSVEHYEVSRMQTEDKEFIVEGYTGYIAQAYAETERISEILGDTVLDTTDLDNEIFKNGTIEYDIDKLAEIIVGLIRSQETEMQNERLS